jgi:hypothetical protein
MAQDRRSAPRKLSKPSELSDPDQELLASLRDLADDMKALCELAVAIEELTTQVQSLSEPSSIGGVAWLLRRPARDAARIH